MKTQTVYICQVCKKRIEYDSEIDAYLEHNHSYPNKK